MVDDVCSAAGLEKSVARTPGASTFSCQATSWLPITCLFEQVHFWDENSTYMYMWCLLSESIKKPNFSSCLPITRDAKLAVSAMLHLKRRFHIHCMQIRTWVVKIWIQPSAWHQLLHGAICFVTFGNHIYGMILVHLHVFHFLSHSDSHNTYL